MRIKLIEVEPKWSGNGNYHQVEIELPSGRILKIYTNEVENGEQAGELDPGYSEIELDDNTFWKEKEHDEMETVREVMES